MNPLKRKGNSKDMYEVRHDPTAAPDTDKPYCVARVVDGKMVGDWYATEEEANQAKDAQYEKASMGDKAKMSSEAAIPFYRPVKEFADWIDGGNEMWIQMYPYGSWTHPIYSDTTIDRDVARRMVQNFNDGVIRKKVLADYDHGQDKAKGGKAAGEIVEVQDREDGLFGRVRFNDIAKKEIDDGEWNYWSTSHYDEWEDPELHETHQFVIDSGALTNRPYVRGMAPLNFSEIFADDVIDDPDFSTHDENGMLTDEAYNILKQHSVIAGGERNALPDSAFLYIEPGGKKDSGGRTVPRKLRHLIISDRSHQIAAKARLEQSKTGSVDGDSWLTGPLRQSLLARVNKMLGTKDHSEGGDMEGEENKDAELALQVVEGIRKQFSLADDADVIAWIKETHDELMPLRELKTQTETRKKFNEEYPEEAAEIERLRERDRETSAKEFSEAYADRRVTNKIGEGDEAKDEPTTLGLSALAVETIREGAKKFSDGTFTVDDYKGTLDAIMNNGIVDYGTHGSSRESEVIEPAGSVRDVRKQFSEVIAQIQETDKLDFEAAYKVAAEKHPDLFLAYKTNKPVVLPN